LNGSRNSACSVKFLNARFVFVPAASSPRSSTFAVLPLVGVRAVEQHDRPGRRLGPERRARPLDPLQLERPPVRRLARQRAGRPGDRVLLLPSGVVNAISVMAGFVARPVVISGGWPSQPGWPGSPPV
jgi:hypothetical protein